MKVLHQNLQRMTPQSKVSLEQLSSKTTQDDAISIKKIQTSLAFTQLFDITPFAELLKQHKQLQKRLVPEQCVESSVSHALTRSKVSRVSKKSDLSDTSPSRDIVKAPSRYTSARLKQYDKAFCQECSRFEPLAFSDCYESQCSDCSCSYCQSDDDQQNKAYTSQYQSSKKSQQDQSEPKPVRTINHHRRPKQPSRVQTSTPKQHATEENRKSRSPSLPTRPAHKRPSSVREKPQVPQVPKFLKPIIKPIERSNASVKAVTDTRSKRLKPQLQIQQEDDIARILSHQNSKDPRQYQIDDEKVKERYIAALSTLRAQSKTIESDLPNRKEIMDRFTVRVPGAANFKNEFKSWGVNQPLVQQSKIQKEMFKEKYEKILEHSKIEVPRRSRSKGYRSKQDIHREETEHRKKQLEDRKVLLHRKFSGLSEAEQARVTAYQRKRSEERRKAKERKESIKRAQEKLDKERKDAFAAMPKKKFHPKKDFTVVPVDPPVDPPAL